MKDFAGDLDDVGFAEDTPAQALWQFAKIHKDSAIPNLLNALTNPDVNIRETSIFILGHSENVNVLKPLLNALKNEEYFQGRKVENYLFVNSFLQIGERAFKPLLNIFNSNSTSWYSKEIAKQYLEQHLLT